LQPGILGRGRPDLGLALVTTECCPFMRTNPVCGRASP